MGEGFNHREPIDPSRIHQRLDVMDLFSNHQWLGIFEKLRGFDNEITQEFSLKLQPQGGHGDITIERDLITPLSEEVVGEFTTLPLGVRWRWSKEESTKAIIENKNFFLRDEKPIKDKNRVKTEILTYPQDKVAYHFLNYISCEGRLSIFYA